MVRNVILFLVLAGVGTLLFAQSVNTNKALINPQGAILTQRILAPKGYTKIFCNQGSFGSYLQNLKVKPDGTKVHYYDGSEKGNNNLYAAVVDMNIGTKDLQQCADVIMHVRAEYLYYRHDEDKIHFTFTNGFRADYSKWRDGYRIHISGNKSNWVKKASKDNSYKTFCEYMDVIYNYCGTLSLSKELIKVKYEDMQPGDILIKGGSPGHAELVMEMAKNAEGKKIYLLSQSYMPAQEMQILTNRNNRAISPWYELNGNDPRIITPEWDFTSNQLMRFSDN